MHFNHPSGKIEDKALWLHAVSYHYVNSLDPLERLIVLAETTLTVNAGEFVAAVGPTGCGKSTLLNL